MSKSIGDFFHGNNNENSERMNLLENKLKELEGQTSTGAILAKRKIKSEIDLLKTETFFE